jgi:MFS transporter, DHA1 family, multidrug resistance protein
VRGLYVVAAVTMAGVSSVFALLAALEDRYDLPSAGLGLIAGSAFAAALVAQLGLSRYADRGHGTRLLRAGVLTCAAGLLWFAAGTELWQFVAARALLGAGVGMILPAARRAIVLTAGARQGEQLGVFYAAYLSGFVLGPPVAAVLTAVADVRLPFLVLGLVTLASLFWVRNVVMPEGRPAAGGGAEKRVMRRLLADRRVLAAVLVIVSFRYSIGVFEPLWAVHLDNLGASTIVIGLSLTVFTLPMLLIARRAGRVSDTYGPRVASLGAAAASVPLIASLGFIPSVPILFCMAIPYGVMEAIESPGTQAAVADAAPHVDAASGQGLGEAAGSLAAAVGALTAAPMFSWWGAGPTWLFSAAVMATLLTTSALLDRPVVRARTAASPAEPTEPATAPTTIV